MEPNCRHLFMKELVMPIIPARVSWLILAMTGSGLPS
jgi:hypothetical protein